MENSPFQLVSADGFGVGANDATQMFDGELLLAIGAAVPVLCHDRVGTAAMAALKQSTEKIGGSMSTV
ncbi:hypothetical protein G6L28_22680 [Agrobacterium larrymoorei]|nr:hypothetical protein [Agrobacterium larrymoorei]